MSDANKSAVEELIAKSRAHYEACLDCCWSEDGEEARAELAALHRRVADLELMLRAAFPDEDEDAPFISHGEACDGSTVFWAHRNADDLDPLTLDSDATGVPILTDAARTALSPAAREAGSCDHRFESNPGMYDTSHRYCAKCGRAE